MGHTLIFNFVFERGQSKEDFLNRILTFLKGFDAEQLFNNSYHPQLEEEIDLMDEVPQNSIKHVIDLNQEDDFNKSVLLVVQYMEHYVNSISGDLPFLISFKKSFKKKKQQLFYLFDIHSRMEVKMDLETIKKELETKLRNLYSNKQKMIELAPVVYNTFDSDDLYLGDLNTSFSKYRIQFDLGFYLFDEMLEMVFDEVDEVIKKSKEVIFEFILHCELQPTPLFPEFKNEPEEELPF
jgi:glycerophosphoryl diester phosphodiesterase